MPADAIALDDVDRLLLNNLQGGFPVTHRPFAEVAESLGLDEDDVIARLRRMVDSGALSRFGTILNAPQLGGERTLAALRVPPERFEEVAAFVSGLDAVSHNYERTHHTTCGSSSRPTTRATSSVRSTKSSGTPACAR